MDFALSQEHAMARDLFKSFAENEVKPLAQEIDEEEYFLAAVAYEDEEEEFDDEDEEEDGVFIFKVCTAEESEFIVLNEDGTTDYYVTTELGDHYDTVIETFQNMSDEFDLIADDDEE